MARSIPGYSYVGVVWYKVPLMAQLYEVQTVWSGVAGSPYYTTARGLLTGGTTPQEMADAMEDFLIAIAPVTDARLVAVINNEVRVIESTDGETQAVLTISGATKTMTGSGDPLPSLAQLLVRYQTGVFTSGRQIRGRWFIPGQLEANNTSVGLPSAGLVTGVDTAAGAFVTACAGDFVIYSPTHRVYASVQGASVAGDWSFLRSRRD
jgi:hypothetical protein